MTDKECYHYATISVRVEERPWGEFTNYVDQDEYKVKKIKVKPGHKLSLQSHEHRQEEWTIVHGKALVTVGDTVETMLPGRTVSIPKNATHRIENVGSETLVFIEVQVGDYLSESDIHRFVDDYGRA